MPQEENKNYFLTKDFKNLDFLGDEITQGVCSGSALKSSGKIIITFVIAILIMLIDISK